MLQPTIESLQETKCHKEEKMTMGTTTTLEETTRVEDELSSRSSCGSECHRRLRGACGLECINCGQGVGCNDLNLAKDVLGAEFDSESNFSS